MQDENVKKDTISQILKAADIKFTDDNVLEVYKANIKNVFVVDLTGEDVKSDKLDIEKCKVYSTSDLKEQLEKQNAFPVYEFENVIVIPCYGAGLWGPIWGYVGVAKYEKKEVAKKDKNGNDVLDDDGNVILVEVFDKTKPDYKTITKACFGHKGETPGLGAKITDEPAVFADKFAGKAVGPFTVAKNVAATDASAVNAISGATITSQAVGKALNQWFGFYENYFAKMRPAEVVTE
jgi:Na+-transporting NADH:ubiquinone oxidoreductase subunit C